MREEIIWQGRSSQMIQFKTYFFGTIGCLFFLGMYSTLGAFALIAALACAGKMLWAYFTVRSGSFTITNKAFIYEYGLLTRRRSFIELYRIHDTTLIEPLWLRLFGLGTIRLITAQWSSEYIAIEAIPYSRQVQNLVRGLAEGRVSSAEDAYLDYGTTMRALN